MKNLVDGCTYELKDTASYKDKELAIKYGEVYYLNQKVEVKAMFGTHTGVVSKVDADYHGAKGLYFPKFKVKYDNSGYDILQGINMVNEWDFVDNKFLDIEQ